MERLKPTFNVLEKIEKERLARGWSEYTLAQNSNLPTSTISTWYRKNLQPNIASIEKICNGLGVTLSYFFSNDDYDFLTTDQKEILEIWKCLSKEEKKVIIEMLNVFCITKPK